MTILWRVGEAKTSLKLALMGPCPGIFSAGAVQISGTTAFWTAQIVECIKENAGKRNRGGCCSGGSVQDRTEGPYGYAPVASRGRRDDKGKGSVTSTAVTRDGEISRLSAVFVAVDWAAPHVVASATSSPRSAAVVDSVPRGMEGPITRAWLWPSNQTRNADLSAPERRCWLSQL